MILAGLGLTANRKGVFSSPTDSQIFFWLCIVLLILGLVMSAIGFMGCCGACKESQCMLGIYVTFMVLGLILTIVGGVMLHQNRHTILRDALDGVRRLFDNLQYNPEAANLLQEALKCCGAQDVRDWSRVQVGFPSTCCIERYEYSPYNSRVACQSPWSLGFSVDQRTADQMYYPGCLYRTQEVFNLVADYTPVLLGFIGLFQVLAFAFSLALCCAIRNNTYKAGYQA